MKLKQLYPAKLQQAIEALLNRPAVTEPELRRATAAFGQAFAQPDAANLAVEAEMMAYLKKVTQHAYKITDEEVARLKALGYSEDALYELTLCAALGAGLGRLERGLHALKGEDVCA